MKRISTPTTPEELIDMVRDNLEFFTRNEVEALMI